LTSEERIRNVIQLLLKIYIHRMSNKIGLYF
jgi:hypothetical protein